MEKFITITNTTTGQKRLIDLTRIGGFSSTSTELTIEYLHPSADNTASYVITHDTASPATAFKDWFVDQMESVLSGNWREVVASPEPPYAVTAISNV